MGMELFVSYSHPDGFGWVVLSNQEVPKNVQDIYRIANKIKTAENLVSCVPISFFQMKD